MDSSILKQVCRKVQSCNVRNKDMYELGFARLDTRVSVSVGRVKRHIINVTLVAYNSVVA